MTAADRLRTAADRLEHAYRVRGNAGRHTQQQLTTAALLRAVADDEGWFAANELWQHPTWTAAQALADVILGGTDG